MFSIYRLLPRLHQALVWDRAYALLPFVRHMARITSLDDNEAMIGHVDLRDVTGVAEIGGPAPLTTRTYEYPRRQRSGAARRRR